MIKKTDVNGLKKITREEFIAWIMQQPPEKEFNFGETRSAVMNCGCPMVQYGITVLDMPFCEATMSMFNVDTETPIAYLDCWIDKIIPTHLRGWVNHTYHELQTFLKYNEA